MERDPDPLRLSNRRDDANWFERAGDVSWLAGAWALARLAAFIVAFSLALLIFANGLRVTFPGFADWLRPTEPVQYREYN